MMKVTRFILLFALTFAFVYSSEFLTMHPSTVTQSSTVKNAAAWSNINNVLNASDAQYARANVGSNGVSQTLQVTNFRFNVPAEAIIEGIQVTWSKGSQASFNDSDVSLIVAGSVVNTTNKCSLPSAADVCQPLLVNGTSSFRDDSFGGATDLWGLSLTPVDVNDVGFGAALQVKRIGSASRAAYIESVKMTVFYSVPVVTPTAPTQAPTQDPTQQQTQPATQPATQPPVTQSTQQQPTVEPTAFTQSATEQLPGNTFDPTINAASKPAGIWVTCALLLVCLALLL